MKKLMMTTVAALGFAALAQADVLNSTGFEGYGSNPFKVNATDTGATEGDQFWTGDGSADFSQTVLKTYAEAEINAPTNVPDAFKGAASNATFLSVDTGNDVMYRRAAADPQTTLDLSNGKPVFFDADVKFTASETNVEASDGDKLLVWLKGDDTTTNLIVTAGLYNGTSGVYDKTPFIIDGNYSADTWYRLTVKATRVLSGDGENYTTAFNVYIDGELVTSGDTDLFYSLVQQTDKLATTIAEAGFQGTGALDNVVWTTTDPFPAEGTYTLTFTPDSDFSDNVYQVTVDGAEGDSAKAFETDGIGISKTTVTVVVKTADVSGTVKPTTGAAGVTFSKVETTSEVIEDGEGGSYTDYTYTFTVTVAEPAVDANYAIALSFVPGAVIDEDVDLTTQSKLSLDKDSIKEGEAAPTVTVMVGDNTLTVGTDYTVTTDYDAGTSKAGTYTITVTAVANSGYTGSNTITFTVTAEEPTTVVTPTAAEIASGEIPVTGETTAIKIGTIEVPIEAFDVNAGVATVKAPVVAESAEAAGDAFVIDDEKDEVTINVNPVAGLYYGVSAETDLDALARPAALTQYDGTNAAEIFTVSKPGDEKGFFKVYSDVKE